MKNNSLNYKKNNKGFSLFAVIVAIAFTGILGMLVVYIAMSNFYMKITDWKGKDSFYTAEQAIEEIRVMPCQRLTYRFLKNMRANLIVICLKMRNAS